MEITVKVADLIGEVESAITDYQDEYKKALKLYHEKLVKYAEKVQECINTGTDKLPYSPSAPDWIRDSLEDNLEALRAHQETVIKLGNNEYKNIKSGIKYLHDNIVANVRTLSSLDY